MTVSLHRLLCLCAVLWLGVVPAHAKRIALVIGNDNYLQVTKLEKAGNDAEAMARELAAAGFEVTKHRDLPFKQMVVAFESFFDKVKGGDQVTVFYAGHGVQTDRGSYLLPIDIEGETQSQIEKTSYSVNGLLEELDRIKPQFSLLIVDACRDNPLRSRGRTIGIARGLNAPDLAKGQMVIFSAGKNQRALDALDARDTNPNGVFTREFVARMRRPGVSVESLAIEVKNSVEQIARTINHDQRPLIVNDSTGDFYFFAPTQSGAAGANPSAPVAAEALREDLFWQDTKAPDNVEGYQAYLGTYPNGRYAGLARANISRLNARAAGEPAALPAPVANAPPAPAAARPAGSDARGSASAAGAARGNQAGLDAGAAAASGTGGNTTSGPGAQGATRADAAGGSTRNQTSYTLANGDKYEGETVGAMRTGQGKYQFANGDRYEGTLVDNSFSGKGVMSFAFGDRYEGYYLRGAKHGQGVYVFANKDRYEGGYANNLFEGKGSFIYVSGERYDGDFARGVKHGQGVYRFANGERYEGAYVDNLFDGAGSYLYSSGDRFEGEYRRGAKQGQGTYRFANGDRYEGSFVNNLFNGKGKLFLSTRDRYEGDFRDNVKDGTGVHFFANGDRYEGSFRGGAQSGAGTHFYANGDKYVGAFEAGLRHGRGTYHFANGQTRELEFVKGTEKTN